MYLDSPAYKELCKKEDAVARELASRGTDVSLVERLVTEAGLPETSKAIVQIKAQRINEGHA